VNDTKSGRSLAVFTGNKNLLHLQSLHSIDLKMIIMLMDDLEHLIRTKELAKRKRIYFNPAPDIVLSNFIKLQA